MRYKKWLLVLVVIVTFFVIVDAGPLMAQVTGGKTLIENSIGATQTSEDAVTKLWIEIFQEDNVMYQAVVAVATGFLAIFFLLTILPILNDAGNFNWRGVGSRFAWIIVVTVLLGNDAAMLRTMTFGLHDMMNQTASSILQVQVDEMTMRDALHDVIISEDARKVIQQSLDGCEAKEAEQQLQCFREGAEKAAFIVEEAEASNPFVSPGLRRLSSRLKETIADFKAAEKAAKEPPSASDPFHLDQAILNNTPLGKQKQILESPVVAGFRNFALQSTAQVFANQLLTAMQQMFVFGTEIAMLLTGVLGPIAVAASLIPNTPRTVYVWLVAFMTVGFTKLTYNILIAFCAVWIVMAERQETGDFVSLLLMAIAAPVIAMSLSGWGGMSILTSMARSASTAISMIPVPSIGGGK